MPRSSRHKKCKRPHTLKAKSKRMKNVRRFLARQSLTTSNSANLVLKKNNAAKSGSNLIMSKAIDVFESPKLESSWPASEEISKANLIATMKDHFNNFPLLDLQEMNLYLKDFTYLMFEDVQQSRELSLSYNAVIKESQQGININIKTTYKDICKELQALSINLPGQKRCLKCHKLEHKKVGNNGFRCIPCLNCSSHPIRLSPWPLVSFPKPHIKTDADVFSFLSRKQTTANM